MPEADHHVELGEILKSLGRLEGRMEGWEKQWDQWDKRLDDFERSFAPTVAGAVLTGATNAFVSHEARMHGNGLERQNVIDERIALTLASHPAIKDFEEKKAAWQVFLTSWGPMFFVIAWSAWYTYFSGK